MPGIGNLEPNSKDQQKIADDEFKSRRTHIDKNRSYYEGDMHKPMKDDEDNVIINMCAEIVDQTVSFLLPKMPEFEVDNDADTSEDEQWLTNFWEANGGARLMTNIVTNGALAGQSYAKVKPAEESEEADHPYPRIVNLDPSNAVTWWQDDNYQKIKGFELRWNDRQIASDKTFSRTENEARTGHRQVVKYDGKLKRWDIYEYAGSSDGWTELTGEMATWAHPLPPIVSVQHLPKTNDYYGRDELPHRVINDAINAVASDMKAITKFFGDPQVFAFGVDKNQLQESLIGGIFAITNTDARVEMMEAKGDLAMSLNLMHALEHYFFRRGRVVQLPPGLDSFRGMTNLGIRTAFMPQLTKNETLRRSYSTFIERVSRVALMVDGRDFNIPLRIRWGSALPVDDKEEIANLQMEMAMGIMSKEMAATRRGYNYDMVRQQITREEMEAGLMRGGAPFGVSG